MDPLARARSMANIALQRGAKLFGHTKADSVTGNLVQTNNGHSIRCRRVIVAVDGCLDKILPELSDRVETKRLQVIATEPAKDVYFPMPVHREDDYW